jgi:putative transposase
MSTANVTWGSPRIVGELRKLRSDVAKSTVDKYLVRSRKPLSPTWKSFLNNHAKDTVSLDFLVVPTVRFNMLYVLVILIDHRRKVVHFNVTEHLTAHWTGQQIIEAFPYPSTPKYLILDRDGIHGNQFRKRVQNMGIEEVLTALRSPWQNAFVERMLGSPQREDSCHLALNRTRSGLRSTAITAPSPLLRMTPPLCCAWVLWPLRGRRLSFFLNIATAA